MSKQIEGNVTCGKCNHVYLGKLYRSLWIEDPKNRSMVFNDEVNVVTCPSCKHRERIEFPFLCTNVKRGIALWYEPYPDKAIDDDIRQYTAHFGANSFYAKAPRIRDWNEFKNALTEMEHTTNSRPENLDISKEFADKNTGFVKSIQKNESNKGIINVFMRNTESIERRLAYSAVPFLALLVFIIVTDSSGIEHTLNVLAREISSIIMWFTVWAITFFIIISALRMPFSSSEWTPWNQRPKGVRQYIFGFVCWTLATVLYVFLADPYDNGSWSYMSFEEFVSMILIAFLPPIFVGLALYVYEKHIK